MGAFLVHADIYLVRLDLPHSLERSGGDSVRSNRSRPEDIDQAVVAHAREQRLLVVECVLGDHAVVESGTLVAAIPALGAIGRSATSANRYRARPWGE